MSSFNVKQFKGKKIRVTITRGSKITAYEGTLENIRCYEIFLGGDFPSLKNARVLHGVWLPRPKKRENVVLLEQEETHGEKETQE